MPKPNLDRPPPIVSEQKPGVWVAGSRSRLNHFHVVNVVVNNGVRGFTCSCEHFTLGEGKVCAHIRAVEAELEARWRGESSGR